MAQEGLPASFELELLTPRGQVFHGEATELTLPGAEGELGVLPGHQACLAALRPGPLRYRDAAGGGWLAISGGVAEISATRVVVLSPSAEPAAQIDAHRAEATLRDAEQRIEGLSLDSEEYAELDRTRQRALTRLTVAASQDH